MRRTSTEPPSTCATCEVEIHSQPTMESGVAFCCPGCRVGGPCSCSYDADGPFEVVRHCHDVGAPGDVRRMLDA